MLIAIISDSHGGLDRLREALENLDNGGVKYVIHAGDFAVYDVEEVFTAHPEIKFWIARGNCDINEEVLEKVRQLPNVKLRDFIEANIDGVKLVAAHHKEDLVGKDADVYISGHTHVPKIKQVETHHGVSLQLNPGSLFEDNRYFLLDTKTLQVKQILFNEQI